MENRLQPVKKQKINLKGAETREKPGARPLFCFPHPLPCCKKFSTMFEKPVEKFREMREKARFSNAKEGG